MAIVNGYIVKYWSTAGITPVVGKEHENGRLMTSKDGFYQSFSPKEWDKTLSCAKEKAEALRCRKIASLQSQVARISNLKIEVKAP